MASADVSGSATMSDLDLGKLLWCELGKTGVTYASVGALARNLCAQPAPSSLPAGLVVRDHRVVAGGWESEPTREFYVRYANGHPSGVHCDLLWPSFSKPDVRVTGWCHADEFLAAINAGGAPKWVTRTAPRVEWLPWTQGRPAGQWWMMDVRGKRWTLGGAMVTNSLMATHAVAYWPADPGLDLSTLTAAILAGEV